MKKIFVASVFLGLASMAQAAFITCSPAQSDFVVNAAGTSAVFNCNQGAGSGAGSADDNLAGDGWSVQSIRLRVSGTFQENAAPTGSNYSVAFSSVENSAAFNLTPGCTASGSENGSNQALGNCTATSAVTAVGPVDALGNFTVTVTGAAGSTPLPFNASASVSYEVVQTQDQAPVPEPATYTMLGVGLVGFYLARRKA